MARARNIKPGFFTNDELGDCDPLARLLFAGLWTIADREGRLEYRPKRIKAEILPYDDCDVSKLLQSLETKGFITIYEVDEAQYIQVNNWNKHQNPHVKEVASSIPAPNQHHTSTVQEQEQHRTNPADSLNLIPDSLNLITLTTTTTNTNVDSGGGDEIIAVYQNEIGQITGIIAEELAADRKQYGDKWVRRAISIAAEQGKRSYAYMHGILTRWWTSGFKPDDNPWEQQRKKPAKTVDPDERAQIRALYNYPKEE